MYYRGSQAEWNGIYIEDQDNDFLKNANIHYNSNYGGQGTVSGGGGGTVSPVHSGGTAEIWTDGVIVNENNLDIEDLRYRYIAGEDEYNPNSVGVIRPEYVVTDNAINRAQFVAMCSRWDIAVLF